MLLPIEFYERSPMQLLKSFKSQNSLAPFKMANLTASNYPAEGVECAWSISSIWVAAHRLPKLVVPKKVQPNACVDAFLKMWTTRIVKGTRASSAFRRRCQTLCVDLWSLKSICLRVPDRCIFFAMISPVSQADNGSFYREGHGSLISTHGPRSLYLSIDLARHVFCRPSFSQHSEFNRSWGSWNPPFDCWTDRLGGLRHRV